MVKTISEHISMCEKRAAECRANAAASLDPLLNRELLDMEQRWLNIARSYAYFRDLEEYLLELHNNQIPSDPAPPKHIDRSHAAVRRK